MQFKDVCGQERAKQKLIEGYKSGRVSHAQLFIGKNGFGGLPLALAYVQFISCANKSENDSCGTCPSCLKIQKLAHPDLHFSFPCNKNEKVTHKHYTADDFVEDFRTFLLEKPYGNLNDWHQQIDLENKQSLINVDESQSIIKKLNLKPYESAYKFLILWMPERMNLEAANKLLKLIEEPTPNTLILLVAEDQEQLLVTITSRTQILNIPPLSEAELSSYLAEQSGLEQHEASRIAALSDGNLGYAISQLEKRAEEEQFFQLFKDWMRACYKADLVEMNRWVEEISKSSYGREGRKRFLEYALKLMRESILKNYTQNNLSRIVGDEADFLAKFAPFIHGDNILAITEVLNDAHMHIGRNAYAKIIFMDMSMKFANLLRVKKRTFVD